jgi:hypothetical protein
VRATILSLLLGLVQVESRDVVREAIPPFPPKSTVSSIDHRTAL